MVGKFDHGRQCRKQVSKMKKREKENGQMFLGGVFLVGLRTSVNGRWCSCQYIWAQYSILYIDRSALAQCAFTSQRQGRNESGEGDAGSSVLLSDRCTASPDLLNLDYSSKSARTK